MASEQKIRTTAAALFRRHGESALDVARRMIRRYAKAGDSEAAAEWQRIARALDRPRRA